MKQLLLLLALIFCSCTNTLEAESKATYSDIAYASVSSKQKLDLYIPTTGLQKYPLIVWIHGGAFMMGDKAAATETSMCNALVAKGFVVASLNYRLSSEAIYPAQIQDCKAAVRFLRANAATYKIDPDRVASWGGSAGGCLASLLGTTGGVTELEGSELGNAGFSSRVVVAVDWFGPIEFLTMDAQAAAQGFTINTNAATSPESKLIGAAIQTVPVQTNKANAMAYVTADDAAMYCQHGTADVNIPRLQSENLYNAIKTTLGDTHAVYELLTGAGHGGAQFTAAANVTKIVTFINTHFAAVSDIENNNSQDGGMLLHPNYPNPFNPTTQINFSLEAAKDVKLAVYNAKGEQVQELAKSNLPAGMHTYQFDGSNLNSGVYFCRLQAGNTSVTQKLSLIK